MKRSVLKDFRYAYALIIDNKIKFSSPYNILGL